MISNEQRELKKRGYFTPNEAAKILGISRRSFMRLFEAGIVRESETNTRNHFFSVNDIVAVKNVLCAKKLGLSDEQIIKYSATGVTEELMKEVFGPVLLWLHMCEADAFPFGPDVVGRITEVPVPTTVGYVHDCKGTVGWEGIIRSVHDAFLEVFRSGNIVGDLNPAVYVDFREDGIPVANRIMVPVMNKDAEKVEPFTISNILYAEWIGNPQEGNTPANVFDSMGKIAESSGREHDGQKIVFIAQDYVSMETFDLDRFICYLGYGIKLPGER